MSNREELAKIVGDENVIDDVGVVEKYSYDESFIHPIRPQLLVKIKNREDIQQIVKWANKTLTPLVPVSSGPPHFRGDTVPSTGGAVIVDLSGMKKILWINRKNQTAIVEPGVTFSELQPALEKEGIRLNGPVLPRRNKSVLASILEMEPVIMPKFHWEPADPLGCLELIWGSGDLFRTGSLAWGSLDDLIASKSAINYPMGPGPVDYHRLIQGAQGTMGIATFASIRCEKKPSVQEPFIVATPNIDEPLELTYWLLRHRFAEECLIINKCNLGIILAKQWPDDYLHLRGTLPNWVLLYSLNGYEYFPEERIAYQREDIKTIAKKVGIEPRRTINGLAASEILNLMSQPSDEPLWKLRYKGACRDIFFLSKYEKLAEFLKVVHDVSGKYDYPVSDIGVYLQPIMQGTCWHCEFTLFFDSKNVGEVEKVRRLFNDASQNLMDRGAYFLRPYGPWANMVYSRDAETTATLRNVKRIFDPNNIMNPGKLCF